jgi:aspartate kinase
VAKIFKFGGASIKNAAAFKNVGQIVSRLRTDGLVLVVSALGKTTNALEKVVNAYMSDDTPAAFAHLQAMKDSHQAIIDELFADGAEELEQEINDLFVDIEWIIEEPTRLGFDYTYDQIVSVGELLSTKILAAVLREQFNLPVVWLDARDCVRTDNTYRDAKVDWQTTQTAIRAQIARIGSQNIALTQGFIGSTDENFTTTLGREGSDYTAAIFAYCLDAQDLTIWKDVAGVLTADPNVFADRAILLPQISYEEAIEMTYYGAQVIHPNTLRPLQNKQIPLRVKSFLQPDADGTCVGAQAEAPDTYPPIIVVKNNQALLKISSRTFHFIDEARFAELFAQLAAERVKVNMIQHTALAFSICVDYHENRLARFIEQAQNLYDISLISGLKLLTLRYATPQLEQEFTDSRHIYLSERIRQNTQLLMSAEEKL